MSKRYYTCVVWFAAVLSFSWIAGADVIIGTGETLSITNTEDIGITTLQMNDGAALEFLGSPVASPGLNEYERTTVAVGTPFATGYGTWIRVSTNVYWAGTNITATQTEYIYTGRWYVPDAGVYSFYEFIDDHAAIAVDGFVVIRDLSYSTETCVQNIPLVAGWHDLEVRVYNGSVGGGMASAALKCGILYSPSNDLISVSNQADAYPFVDPGDGSVLQSVHNGNLFQKTLIDGDVTFDLSGLGLAAPLVVSGGLWPQPGADGARVTVNGGVGEVIFAGSTANAINFPPFNVDVAFSGVVDPAGVTFRDQTTVVAFPTSCPWRVADDAVVALAGTNTLGAGDVVLTNHSIIVLAPTAVENDATIRVQGTNLTASIKPCNVDVNGTWWGFPATYTNDVSLEGENATLAFPLNSSLYLQGSISGTGTVYKTNPARLEILEGCDFVGPVVCNSGTLVFDDQSAGDSNNVVTIRSGATLALYPSGYGSTETATWIKRVEGSSVSGKVYVPTKQTMVVDTLEGMLGAEGASVSSSVLHINTLGTNAVLQVIRNLTVEVDYIAPGASIIMSEDSTALSVTGAGNTLQKLTLGSGDYEVSGDFTVEELTGTGVLVKTGASTLQVVFSELTGGMRIDQGAVHCQVNGLATNSVLGSLPSLWLDASADGVFTQYKTFTFTNGFEIIEQWDDCRPYATGYAKQTRGDDQWQTYPYAMTNALNGMSVLSMGSYQTMLPSPYNRTEARRMPLDYTRTPEVVIMVVGSQNGGGAAVLGTNGGGNSFTRGGSTAEDYRNPATPILEETGFDLWVDGVSVDATTTGLSGGYQILTIDTDNYSVGALGWDTSYQTAGGQNYAELLFFTNILTSVQRASVEAYLAKKWNLPYTSFILPSVEVAAGATLKVGGSCVVSNVFGYGSVIVSETASVNFGGMFTGSVDMDGGTFAIADLPDIPDEDIVPQSDRSLWIDPCQTNRAVLGSALTPSRPLAISGLYDRMTDSRYLLGTCNINLEGAVDRRPWLSETNSPLGNTLYWIDYENIYDGETRGNTLRLNTNPAYIGTQNTVAVPTNVQSGFIVLDSSRGGGVPITYNVSASQVVTRDNPQSVSSPIWGSGTTSSLKSGATYLDGQAVDGATQGYSGTPELLSFVSTDIFQAAYFGYYGGDSTLTPNRERLGEIILFDSVVSEGTRADIEAYLMKKWLGLARSGYSDMTEATVSGSGAVQAVRPTQLPAFDPGFTGNVTLSGTSFDWTVKRNAVGEYITAPATVIPGALSVAATGTINVNFAVKPPAGKYTLMTYGSIGGAGFNDWTLNMTGDQPSGSVLLKATETELSIVFAMQGTVILVK